MAVYLYDDDDDDDEDGGADDVEDYDIAICYPVFPNIGFPITMYRADAMRSWPAAAHTVPSSMPFIPNTGIHGQF